MYNKNNTLLFCIALLLSVGLKSVSYADDADTYSFYMISCGSYINHRSGKNAVENVTDAYYVAGWVSAYNKLSSHNHNIGEDTDLESIMLWLEKYCRENPLNNLATGLSELAATHPVLEKPAEPPVPTAPTTAPATNIETPTAPNLPPVTTMPVAPTPTAPLHEIP